MTFTTVAIPSQELYLELDQSMNIDDRKINRSIDGDRLWLGNWHRPIDDQSIITQK